MTQSELILAYIRNHGSITQLEAISYCNRCTRLAARISDINAKLLGWTEYHLVNENPMGKYGKYRFETDEERKDRLDG